MREEKCRLYLISPNEIADLGSFKKTLHDVLTAGDVACFQLRLKTASDEEILEACAALMPVCHDHDVAFLVNDRADLAASAGADGVHLGQSDGTLAGARALLGDDASIGVTCHDSFDLAFEAGEGGADYVAFGAFFETDTKKTDYKPEPDILTAWDTATIVPCVAIGGITVDNCDGIIAARAHFIAVSGGVWRHSDGAVKAVEAFMAKIAAGPNLAE